MFLEKYIINTKKIIGIELLIKNDSYEWRTVSITKHKNEINYQDSEINIYTEITKDIVDKFDCPVIISITGKGIIHKKVNDLSLSDDNLLNQAIPNINASEFYFQKYYNHLNAGYISIIRKNQLDKILSLFKDNRISVLELYLGPFIFSNFKPYISLGDGEYMVSEYVMEYQNTLLDNIRVYSHDDQPINQEYKIDGDNISHKHVLAYSASISLISIDHLYQFKHNINLVGESILEYKYEQYYKKGLLFSLSVVFIILLINFTFYSVLFDKNKILIEHKSVVDTDVKKIQEQKNNIVKSRDFLNKIGWEKRTRLSPFIDDIASTIPTTILLTELTIHPINKSNLNSEQTEFKQNIININGNCNLPTDLNLWINDLKDKSWIKGVQVVNYFFDNNLNKGVFNIIISY